MRPFRNRQISKSSDERDLSLEGERERETNDKYDDDDDDDDDGLVLIDGKTSQTEVVPGRDAMLCLDV